MNRLALALGALALALGALGFGGIAAAHPTHVTIGEAHWRPARQVVEVSLRLPTHHVQRVMSDLLVDRAALQAYVRQGFLVDGATLGWIGAEIAVDETWVHFEIPAKAGQILTLRNRLFFERSPSQVNTVNLDLGPRRLTLQWSAGAPTQQVTLPAAPTAPAAPITKERAP